MTIGDHILIAIMILLLMSCSYTIGRTSGKIDARRERQRKEKYDDHRL